MINKTCKARWALASWMIAALILSWRFLLFHGHIPFDGNMVTIVFPNWTFAQHMLSAGHWPLWNPFRDMGEPFWADPQSMAAYPGMWILSPVRDFKLFLILWYMGHSLMAALFYAALAYYFTKKNSAAVTAALLGTLNGYFTAHLSPNVFASASWVPVVLYGIVRGSVWGGGAALALQWLSGFPDFSILTVGVAIAFYLSCGRDGIRRLIGSGFVALGLAFCQFLPFLEYFSNSVRSLVLPPREAVQFSLQPGELMRMLWIPQWIRFKADLSGDPAVMAFYIGVPAMLLALYGLWKGSRRERFWAAGVFACLVLSIGEHLPGFHHLRILHFFCYPAHWLLLASVGLTLLAASGMASLRSRRQKGILLFIITLDLVGFAQIPRIAWVEPAFLTETPTLAAKILSSSFPTRIYHTDLFLAAWQRNEIRTLNELREFGIFLTPSYGMAFDVGDVQSHQVLLLQRTAKFLARLRAAGPGSSLLKTAGVSTVVTLREGEKDITKAVVVQIPSARPPLFLAAPPHAKGSQLSDIRLSPGRAEGVVKSPTGQRLVLNQVLYPGWEARIDAQRISLTPELETFIAADIPPGEHHVTFSYSPIVPMIGAVISFLTVLVGLCWFFI